MRLRTALLLLCAAAPTPLPAQAPGAVTLAARIDSIVAAELAAKRAPGISVAVVRGTDTIALKGYGLADVENRVPVTDLSVFRIGSVTKQFTAAAVLKLVEDGRVRLDAPLSQYLPDYRGPGARVTVHQLLNHTSGIPSFTALGEEFRRVSRLDLTHDEMLALFAGDSLEFDPGSQWKYSNSGYYLLGMLIEKVTGEGYAEHLERTQFGPLGLGQTLYCSERPIIPHRAEGYGLANGVLVNAEPISMNPPGAAGALCSTPRDLVRWTEALNTGRVVSVQSYERMTTATTLPGGNVQQYGYGLMRGRLEEHEIIQHSGGINGFGAFMSYYPSSDLTVVVLANGPTNTGTIAGLIARVVLGLPLPPPPPPAPTEVPIGAAELARYVGGYDLTPTLPLQVELRVEDGRLIGQATGQGPIPFTHIGNHTFVGPPGSDIRLVFTVEGSRATQFVLHQGGRTTVARRTR